MEKENNKRKISIIITSIIVVMIILVGISYAYFSSKAVSSEQTVTTGNVGLTFDDSTSIVNASNIRPILREEVLTKAAKKTFKITNTGSKSYVDIKLDNITLPTELKRYDFLWSIYENGVNLGSGSFEYVDNEVVLTSYRVFEASVEKTYDLYIWIEEVGLEQNIMQGKEFKANITADSYAYYTSDEDDFTFDSGTGEITGYTGSETDIVIPPAIGGVNVTSIGGIAFKSKNLTSVVIPEGVTSIGAQAFNGNQLTNIVIPSSVTTINLRTFTDNRLTNVVIPNSVTSIGLMAFSSNQLKSVVIPNSVTSIGNTAFSDNQLTNVVIPNSVTSIGVNTFYNNQLTNVIIPNSVTSIGESAFDSNQLKSVVIPNSVTSIGVEAFYNNQLTNVTIANSVTSIGESAFCYNQLTNVIIPSSVISIGSNAFSYNQLKSVVIPNSVTSIGANAFTENLSLTQITVEKLESECTEFESGWYDNSVTTVTYKSN